MLCRQYNGHDGHKKKKKQEMMLQAAIIEAVFSHHCMQINNVINNEGLLLPEGLVCTWGEKYWLFHTILKTISHIYNTTLA